MAKIICQNCKKVYDKPKADNCPNCNSGDLYEYSNSEEYLEKEAPLVIEERKNAGLECLVGGLDCIIINTQSDRQKAAVEELVKYTGLEFAEAFQDTHFRTCVLRAEGSADVLVRSRVDSDNPFAELNLFPKSRHLPDTRIETYVFSTKDLDRYVSIQKSRDVRFLTDNVIDTDNFSFIQTLPSRYTGNSLGFIQWKKGQREYITGEGEPLNWQIEKPAGKHLSNIKELDHTATRVRAEERDAAIIEFMQLTNYNFKFAIYVKSLNSITSVARHPRSGFAMVFTSGISPFVSKETAGPTEMFIHNYGTRVHHMAFRTEHIEDTFSSLKRGGMDFLVGLVGSPDEGLKQTFSAPSENTLLVNEYIYRYRDFDGFFTRSNVTMLTKATEKQ